MARGRVVTEGVPVSATFLLAEGIFAVHVPAAAHLLTATPRLLSPQRVLDSAELDVSALRGCQWAGVSLGTRHDQSHAGAFASPDSAVMPAIPEDKCHDTPVMMTMPVRRTPVHPVHIA
jgi:hypothetical protein